MAVLTIRNLDDDVKARLRLAAATAGISMEELVRRLLTERFGDAVVEKERFGSQVIDLFAGLGPVPIPERDEFPREVELG